MPVTESEKLGLSVHRFEHIPIKKRRLVFKPSSPTHDIVNPPLEGAGRNETSVELNSNVSSVSATSGVYDHKLDENKLVKDDDFSGKSIVSDQCGGSGVCLSVNNVTSKNVEFNENENKLVKDDDFSGKSILSDRCGGSGVCLSVNNVTSKNVEFNENENKLVKDDDFSGKSILSDRCGGSGVCLLVNNVTSKNVEFNENKLVKDDDFSGKSIPSDRCGGSGVCLSVSNVTSKNVEFNENNVKKEPVSHASTALSKDQESTLYSSTLNAPFELALSKMKQEPNIQKSPARDVRFNWDLNTVMVAWEEPSVNEHEISANSNATCTKETKNNYTKDKDLKAEIPLSHENKNLKAEIPLSHENKNLKAEICEPLSHDYETAQNAMVVKTESIYCSSVDIPVTRTLTLENPTHGSFLKWDNLSGQNSHGFGITQAVDTTLSIDCSMPPRCFDSHACKEKVGPTTKHDLTLNTKTCMENGPDQSGITSNKVDDDDMTKRELSSKVVAMENIFNTEKSEQSVAVSSMHDATYSDVDNGLGYGNSQSDNRPSGGMDKLDESWVGYDSQYEDGELRESTINAWKGYELTEGQNEYNMNKIEDGLDPSIVDASEINSQNVQENSSAIRKSTEVGSVKADSTPSVFLPEKLHSIDEALSVSEPYEMISCQENSEKSERQDIVQQRAANQSDEWKMNVSGWDLLPENQRINSNNFTKNRNFSARKFSYREEQTDRFDTEDVDMKAEGLRFSRKESRTCIGEPSTRDAFPNRGRFQMQRFSSKDDGGLISRPERESGALRSIGRGRYSPNNRPSGRGNGLWNPSLGRNREGGSSYHRPMLEDSGTIDSMMNECDMDLSDAGRHNTSSYVTRRPFRSRSPMNQEVNDFRARLGLRPIGDTDHERFVSPSRGRGRGRSMRYDTRLDDEGSRERYHGRPTCDDYNEFMTEYPHPFPRTRRCPSPIERRGNNNSPYQHHQFDSRSPSGPRTCSPIGNNGFRRRSRSPGFRSDGRIRLPRSPTYRDHPSEYNLGPRNNNLSPPSSRWVNYKEGPVFNRSPPLGRADGQHRERFSFYDSSRKPKQDEYYRSEPAGRFLDISEGGRGRPRYVGNDNDQPNNYRRGGFVRRHNMDGPVKRFSYD